MSIQRDEIVKLSKLARIAISDPVVDEVTTSISSILGMVDQLQNVDTDGVEQMQNPLDAKQRLRADTVTEQDQRTAMQSIAPATEDGLYLVPKVID